MSAPRCLLAGATYLVTRRCLLRQFLLRPSRLVNRVVLYCLAVGAERHGIALHTVCFMSNHYHLVLSDPQARLPEFVGWFDAVVARALNALRGRWEAVWAAGSYSAVRLEDEAAVVGACAYGLANPVSAGLVREGHQWPGVRLGPEQIGDALDAQRPHFFFREAGPLPAVAALRLTQPRCFEDGCGVFAERVCVAAAGLEEQARREADDANRGFLGRRGVLAQSPAETARSWEPHRVMCPRVACRDRWRRIEAIQRLSAFLAGYREAWLRYVAGERDVLFPAGTYAMRVRLGVRCAPS